MRTTLTISFAFCLLAGCSGRTKDPPRVPVHPVEGKLIVGGRLAGNSRVVFHPVDKANSIPINPVANTRPDGTFQLMTYTTGDGAPAGEYIVTVVWLNDSIPIDECRGARPHDSRPPVWVVRRPGHVNIALHTPCIPGTTRSRSRPCTGRPRELEPAAIAETQARRTSGNCRGDRNRERERGR